MSKGSSGILESLARNDASAGNAIQEVSHGAIVSIRESKSDRTDRCDGLVRAIPVSSQRRTSDDLVKVTSATVTRCEIA